MKMHSLGMACLVALLAVGRLQAGPYAQLSSTATQTGTTSPTVVTLDSDDAVKGLMNRNGTITIKEAGTYFVMAAAQVGSTTGGKGTVRVWMRMNGKDVGNSNTEQIVEPGTTAVLVCQGLAEAQAEDTVQVVFSVSKGGQGLGLIASRPKSEPAIPSVIFSAFKTLDGPYAQLSSTDTQPAKSTPTLITLNSVDAAKKVDNDKGTITIKEDGVYFVMAAGQAGSMKNVDDGSVKLWMRVNGKDVGNSNTEQTIADGATAVLVCQGIAELKAGDKIQLMQSATAAGGGMIASSPTGEPVVPSMIFSLFKVNVGPYAQLSSTDSQLGKAAGTVIGLNSVDAAKDADNTNGTVTVKSGGTYFAIAAGQVASAKRNGKGSVKLWMGLNGEPVANSNTEQTINGDYTAVLVCQGIAELKGGDRLQLLQSATGPTLGMIATMPQGEPVIPSMIFTLFQVD